VDKVDYQRTFALQQERERQSKKATLRTVPLFQSFSEADLTHISALCESVRLPFDEYVEDGIFVVVEGRVKVMKRRPQTYFVNTGVHSAVDDVVEARLAKTAHRLVFVMNMACVCACAYVLYLQLCIHPLSHIHTLSYKFSHTHTHILTHPPIRLQRQQ
jgi:hypothetical protein